MRKRGKIKFHVYWQVHPQKEKNVYWQVESKLCLFKHFFFLVQRFTQVLRWVNFQLDA